MRFILFNEFKQNVFVSLSIAFKWRKDNRTQEMKDIIYIVSRASLDSKLT